MLYFISAAPTDGGWDVATAPPAAAPGWEPTVAPTHS
jgi:hypothetical protein